MIDYFAWSVARRDLVYNFRQTILTMVVVGISVTLIIFLYALISGLQRRLISSVTGSIPHVVIKQSERQPLRSWEVQGEKDRENLYRGSVISLEERRRKIEDWPVLIPRLEDFHEQVLAVSYNVDGAGIIARGAKKKSISITGVIPERHNNVVDIQSKLVRGRFFGLNSGETALGYKLAEEFNLALGDKVHIVSAEDLSGTYTVAGIFDTGFSTVDESTVFLTLRDAQSLFSLGTAVTSIGLKLAEIFEADNIARSLDLQIPYEATSWMSNNQTLLTGLRAQSQSSTLIIVFTVLASGLGIASILIMSVMSRLREIGILKAMGATRRQIIGVFALEGTLLAFFGSCLGAGLGTGLCLFLMRFQTTASATGRQVEVFPMDLQGATVVTVMLMAIVIGLVASLYPAFRAARTDPVEVIR